MGRKLAAFSLTAADQTALLTFTQMGTHPVRAVVRGRALLALGQGRSLAAVAAELSLCRQTVGRVRERYRVEGLPAALHERARNGAPRRFDGAVRVQLTALACTKAPVGHSRWTLRLLADHAVVLGLVERIPHETVGQVLKKTSCGPSANSSGAWRT